MTNNPVPFIQTSFFQYLSRITPSNATVCSVLEDTLGISKSAAYKRMRGEKELSLSDIVTICREFNISVDQFILPKYAFIGFNSDAIRKQPQCYSDYLKNIVKHLHHLKGLKGISFEFITDDIPFFHYINFPMLKYFKLFAWNNMVWKFGTSYQLFNPYDFDKDVDIPLFLEELISIYYSYKGTEVWTDQLFDASLNQLKYYISAHAFSNAEIPLEILGSLFKLRRHFERMAECGLKTRAIPSLKTNPEPGEIQIYLNNLHRINTTIQARAIGKSVTYISMDVPNFLHSADPVYNQYTSKWIEMIKSKSILISKEGEKERKVFFKTIDKKLEKAKLEIERLIELHL